MARLTVEQKWWIDPRRTFLQERIGAVGGIEVDGLMLRTWRMAQEYWGQGQLIPWRVFSKFRGHLEILDADLAELRTGAELNSPVTYNLPNSPELASNTWVYIRGSKEFFTWIFEIREKRKLGGLRSAESRREKQGTAIPKNARNRPKKPNTDRTPTELPPNSTEVSGSGSGLRKKTKEPGSSPASFLTAKVIATYCAQFTAKFGDRPPIGKREQGIAKRLGELPGPEQTERLLKAFFAMDDPWFKTKGYDLATFEQNLAKITIAAGQSAPQERVYFT